MTNLADDPPAAGPKPDRDFVDLVFERMAELQTEQEKFHFLELMAARVDPKEAGGIYRELVKISISVLSAKHAGDVTGWIEEAASCYGGLPVPKVTDKLNSSARAIYTIGLHGSSEITATAFREDIAIVSEVMQRNQASICGRKLWVLALKLRVILRSDGWLQDKFGHEEAGARRARERAHETIAMARK